jgi:hypothetical protein
MLRRLLMKGWVNVSTLAAHSFMLMWSGVHLHTASRLQDFTVLYASSKPMLAEARAARMFV